MIQRSALWLCLKAYVSQEILNWHSLRHSHSAEIWIIFLCLACLLVFPSQKGLISEHSRTANRLELNRDSKQMCTDPYEMFWSNWENYECPHFMAGMLGKHVWIACLHPYFEIIVHKVCISNLWWFMPWHSRSAPLHCTAFALEPRTTDAQRGNSLHYTAEISLPLPNF